MPYVVLLIVSTQVFITWASEKIIDQAALSAVHSFTQGNPRLIDNLMTDAIVIGSQAKEKVSNAEVIQSAVENQSLY